MAPVDAPKMTAELRAALDALAHRMVRAGNADGGINADINVLAERSGFSYQLLKASLRKRCAEIREKMRRRDGGEVSA